MLEAPQKLSSLPPVVSSDGEPILRGRLKSPADLINCHETFYWADLESALQRTLAQEQRDGVPPYSAAKEKALGLYGRANVNWGLLDQVASEAESPYVSVLDGIDEFCTMPTNYGDEASRPNWEQTMAEELALMLRSWPRFYPLWQQNVQIFTGEGVSFAFFDDDIDWRWTVKGQQYFKFPRRTLADIEGLDMITARIDMLPHRLFEHCQNKAEAEQEGWSPEATWEAIKRCAGQQGIRGNDLQEWEKAWKNNDLILGASNYTVPTVHGWVRELDGTVSHYIAAADSADQKVDQFIYRREGKYRRMSSMVCPYLYGIGANGDFHSIRGIYQKAFAACSSINRVLNRMLDMVGHVSTPWIQAQDEDSLTELPLTQMGMYGVLSKPGVSFTEIKLPPFEQTMIPALGYLQQIFSSRTSGFAAQAPQAIDRTERTKYEKQMQYEQQGRLSTSGMNLFKLGWANHLREVVRRIIRPGYSANDPGGQEVVAFRARCMERGVPAEAIDKVDVRRIEVNLGIGKGSAAERRVTVDTLRAELYFNLDEEGKNRLDYLTAAAYSDARTARELVPLQRGLRPPQDLENANLENQIMSLGGTAIVLPNQNQIVHAQSHAEHLGTLNQGIVDGTAALEDVIPKMQVVQAHTLQHMQLVNQNDPQAAMLRETLNEFNEVIMNGAKQIFAQREKAAREMEHNFPDGDPNAAQQPDAGPLAPEESKANSATLVQAAQAAQKIEDMRLVTSQKLQMKMMETRAKIARDDAMAAAKIRRGS